MDQLSSAVGSHGVKACSVVLTFKFNYTQLKISIGTQYVR